MNRFRPTSCALQTPGSGCKPGLDLVAPPVQMLLGVGLWRFVALLHTEEVEIGVRGFIQNWWIHSTPSLHASTLPDPICVLQFACYPPKNQRTRPWSACLEHRLEPLLCRACTGFGLSIVWHPSPPFLDGFSYLLHAS
jgi:hypothetical protein